MKAKVFLIWMCASLIAVTMVAFAADTSDSEVPESGIRRPAQPARPLPGRPATGDAPGQQRSRPAADDAEDGPRGPVIPAGREDALRAAMARRMEVHRQEVGKLEAILKIAKEEKAERTAEALQELIDEKNNEVRQQVEQAERRRLEMQERLADRLAERRQQQEAAQEAQPARSRPDMPQQRERPVPQRVRPQRQAD